MITLEHVNRKIYVVPDDASNADVQKALGKMKWAMYVGGIFEVKEIYLDELSIALKPFSKDLAMSPAFKTYAVWFRGAEEEKGGEGKSGTILVYAYVNHCIIKSQNFPFEELDAKMKYFFKPAKRSKKYLDGKWDGYIHLLDQKTKRSFPTGLLFIAKEVFTKAGYNYRIIYKYDRSPKKEFDWYVDDGITPDPDQIEAIRLAYEAKRSVCKAPTGFGKTAILAKRLTCKFGVRTLFVANKKSLLDDARDEFIKGIVGITELDVGEIKDGIFGHKHIDGDTTADEVPTLDMPIMVATIQSLHAKLTDERTSEKLRNWLSGVRFCMVDETQSINDKTWKEVFEHIYAPYRVCLSATPRRTDGATLLINAFSGDASFWSTAEEQIEKGRLSEVRIVSRVFDHMLYNEGDDSIVYHEAYSEWIALNEARNRKIVEYTHELLNEGRHVLVLIQFIEHGEILVDMLKQSGLSEQDIRFVYGETSDKARKRAIAEFRKGEFRVLVGSTIFDAGVNIPLISGIVLAGAGNSDITLVQRIGRSVRTADYEDILGYLPEFMLENDGKKMSKVIDIFDANVKFFGRQAYNRYKTAREEFGVTRVSREGKISKPEVKHDPKRKSTDEDIVHNLTKIHEAFKTEHLDEDDDNISSISLADIMKNLKNM